MFSRYSLLFLLYRLYSENSFYKIQFSFLTSTLECSTIFMMMLTQSVNVCVCVFIRKKCLTQIPFFSTSIFLLLFIHYSWSTLLTFLFVFFILQQTKKANKITPTIERLLLTHMLVDGVGFLEY